MPQADEGLIEILLRIDPDPLTQFLKYGAAPAAIGRVETQKKRAVCPVKRLTLEIDDCIRLGQLDVAARAS